MIMGAMCLFLTETAHAQRALPGMRGIEVRAGLSDGFRSSGDSKAGYYLGVAMSRYARNANKWMVGIEFLNRNYPYRDGRLPVAQFTAEGGYYFKLWADPTRTFYFSLGPSAMMGYETVNWGKKNLYDGATLRNKDHFLYGGAVTLEMEGHVTDRIIVLMTCRERILWGTTTGHFHTQFGLGLRFMIN